MSGFFFFFFFFLFAPASAEGDGGGVSCFDELLQGHPVNKEGSRQTEKHVRRTNRRESCPPGLACAECDGIEGERERLNFLFEVFRYYFPWTAHTAGLQPLSNTRTTCGLK